MGCAAAPAARRGGWIGQHRKQLALSGGGAGEVALDANQVWTRLWVGAVPPFDRPLAFSMLVLCAVELQPAKLAFTGKVVRPAFRDTEPLERAEALRAIAASRRVAGELAAGGRVRVTCAPGRNRSALVAALAMVRLTRMTGEQVITQIRAKRSPALWNDHFCALIQRAAELKARPRRVVSGPRGKL